MTTAQRQWIDRAGIFRGFAAEAQIVTGAENSQSLGLHVVYSVNEALNGAAWENWDAYGFVASGTLWVIKRDGAINENAAATARDVLGWDGSLDRLDVKSFQPAQFTVQADEYEGKTRYRIEWFNAFDHTPGPKPLDAGTLSTLKTTHGAKLRAFFGQQRSSAPAPNGRPAAPSASATPPAPPSAEALPASTKQECWTMHIDVQQRSGPADPEALSKSWHDRLAKAVPGKTEAQYTPEDWGRVLQEVSIPF